MCGFFGSVSKLKSWMAVCSCPASARCCQVSWRAIRPSRVSPWLGGVSSVCDRCWFVRSSHLWGALSVVFGSRKYSLARLKFSFCFCCGMPALDVNRHASGRMTESCPMLISAEFAVIISEWFVRVGDETSDASCQSLSSIGVESLVNGWDSPIPMSMVPVVNLESCPAGRSEV